MSGVRIAVVQATCGHLTCVGPNDYKTADYNNAMTDAKVIAGLSEGLWFLTKDGDATLLALYERHYSAYRYADGRERSQFVGPGETITLRTDWGDAGFVWRRFIDDSGERGVNCAFFRNDSPILSSELVRQADAVADFAWPGARHYTYVDPEAVRSTNPGFCFVAAGWKRRTRIAANGKREPYLTGSGKQVIERHAPFCRQALLNEDRT